MFARLIAICTAILCSFLAVAAAQSQTVPPGSCLIPSGQWCWPIAPLTYGDSCECQMPDGTFQPGIVQ